ncbi:SID1 transmembrane family member 1 [Amphibalanus amphitrite]|uniref:SID1 transmembrane family member 1 n=1 Tax=Amphibalanus amphitrite TaxID=1232801 RepID=A0A6A4VL81_AMPAM|nr:SID1 transmembrane family member 1 [Amphibalanus amphitrite]
MRRLPLNEVVTDRVSAHRMHMYAARYTAGASGTMKLRVSAIGDPLPSADMPLSVSVRTSAGGYSFPLPLPAARQDSNAAPATSVSRIMCPSSGRGRVDAQDACFVTLGVGGGPGPGYRDVAYEYELRLSVLNASRWFLETDAPPRQLAVAVAAPIVFQYRWPDDPSVRMVRVGVASGDAPCTADSRPCAGPICDPGMEGDVGACASLAVQRPICPLTLSVGDLLAAASRHLTFTACATTVVKRDDPNFVDGFFVSVLLHEDDSVCYPEGRQRNGTASITKPVRVTISRHDVAYGNIAIPVVLAILCMIIGAVSFSISTRIQARFARKAEDPHSTKEHRSDGEELEEDMATEGRQALQEERPVSEQVPMSSNLRPATVLLTCAFIIVAFGVNSVATDVRNERRSGSLDTCYRNDLCRTDGGTVPDLNHVLSNLPYTGAGAGFLFAVYAQQRMYAAAQRDASVPVGVPHDFSLFASLGVGLMLEGVTSGLYHVCPNNRNSHIDFFFIYYLYAAMGAKLFQTRRGITSRFHYTPALLVAGITLLGSLQDLVSSGRGLWITIMVVHMVCASIWASLMYLTGYVGFTAFRRRRRPVDRITRHIAVTHLVLNVTLAIVGLAAPFIFSDFSMYALLFFTLNSGLYIIFYMLAKKVGYRESPSWLSVLFMLLGLACMVPALVLFVFYNPYNTVASAALSRTSNRPCFAGFFDAHDVWHFLSAAALFFLLMGILTLDDDLMKTPRNKIPVF